MIAEELMEDAQIDDKEETNSEKKEEGVQPILLKLILNTSNLL